MNISSNTLFHFTPKFQYLKSILSEGFWPMYCREYAWSGYDFAVPMTCFCDIPLSQIMNHTKTYGNFGIGMKRKWAIENGLTPVMYIANKSKFFNKIKYKIETIGAEKTHYEIDDFLLLHYIKKVRGEHVDENKEKKQVLFYDEREWRYIPQDYVSSQIYKPVFFKRDEEFDKNKYNNQTQTYKLKFSIEDISYIIIATEADRSKVIKAINNAFSAESNEKQAIINFANSIFEANKRRLLV